MSEIISAKNVTTAYGARIMHDNVSFSVKKAEIYGFLGGSGSGKTTLMKTLIYLNQPKSGEIKIFGEDIWSVGEDRRNEIRLKCGVMFQFGALYSSMNVLENVGVLLREYSNFSDKEINELAMFWIQKVGLKKESAMLNPNELSGGMKKRVALARALALSPEILFLDEPNSGLDPLSSRALDRLVCELRDNLGVTVVMVTHDVDSIFDILDRFLIVDNKKIIFEGALSEIEKLENNPLEELFKMRAK
ncbi:ATP-binding cassette domain-containing protein [Campylobacter sp. VBCF_05 NA6]|uniref:ABC transporter ATP-binding protein n=1 Tax=unclassified Campylobacter TaxID=2593542 RepID=UPI0022E9F104|nr:MULTISPECIES: ATP-binding cassette domain-containing protein [unclassified Campylobacter]MDA3049262.1 ATP-binding cassette domain-containing protein [Campylobacter sp. JMF_15 NE4]MDA3051313.1 ATP-binding cassette domain-containing protein [Campylobacter sp. JMF_02 ED1]MDA3056867.1 ATP-binding cassette domain-containing protein [Campylobacter sp. VBCF_04 NA7]MDA3058635.1 ATP-binding cassette domain-containing protein [Campylobacter sp. VBCF_05 NA6]